jgi:hypothetical protein
MSLFEVLRTKTELPWGGLPPKIGIIDSRAGGRPIVREHTFENYPDNDDNETSSTGKFWDFIPKKPTITLEDGRRIKYKRGYQFTAELWFVDMRREEYQLICDWYDQYDHLVNRGVEIVFWCHADDDVSFLVDFADDPRDLQLGKYPGVVLKFIGSEKYLSNRPKYLKHYRVGEDSE